MRYPMIAAAWLLVLSQAVSGAQNGPVKQYTIQATLKEKPSARSHQQGEVLAEPQIIVVEGRQAEWCVGGEITVGQTKVPFGTNLTATVSRADGNKVRVVGVLDVSSIEREKADDGIVSRESYAVHFDKIVELGATTKVRLSKSTDRERWFELCVNSAQGIQPIPVSGQSATFTAPVGGTFFPVPDQTPSAVSVPR